jgi:hypothetical protein
VKVKRCLSSICFTAVIFSYDRYDFFKPLLMKPFLLKMNTNRYFRLCLVEFGSENILSGLRMSYMQGIVVEDQYHGAGIGIVLLVVICYTRYQTITNILHAKLQAETKK